ncbi:hypothetical protein BDN72DRAFT_400286 [Pluteus cervinus]|uniref:Uncharacterized protein n=1 Tax=Pluteus cervinus TaxID=181527 RepID=A0ACD3B248_9AGAR|nr:hypothetical protein BDN72DRAFT_400286 [Pluteus cervinus]
MTIMRPLRDLRLFASDPHFELAHDHNAIANLDIVFKPCSSSRIDYKRSKGSVRLNLTQQPKQQPPLSCCLQSDHQFLGLRPKASYILLIIRTIQFSLATLWFTLLMNNGRHYPLHLRVLIKGVSPGSRWYRTSACGLRCAEYAHRSGTSQPLPGPFYRTILASSQAALRCETLHLFFSPMQPKIKSM